MLSTLFTAYIMCLRWEWATDSVMCSDGMCVAVGKLWRKLETHQVSVEVLRGVGVVLGRCPSVYWHVGSGLQVFEVRAGAVQGNMERNQGRIQLSCW